MYFWPSSYIAYLKARLKRVKGNLEPLNRLTCERLHIYMWVFFAYVPFLLSALSSEIPQLQMM